MFDRGYQLTILDVLHRVELKLDLLLKEEHKVTAELQALADQVAQNTNLEQSGIRLIQGLAAQISAAADNPQQIRMLTSQLQQSAAALTSAMTANTPAADQPPAPVA